MAKTDTIHIRVNEETKNNAEQTLGSLPFPVQLPAPQGVIINSRADIERKLAEAEQDIAEGNVSVADEAFARLESKYAL